MRHGFEDFGGTWRCLSFATVKKKKYKPQAEMARGFSLQRASSRPRATAVSRKNSTTTSCADRSRWMFKKLSALYTKSQKRSKAKESFAKMICLNNSSFESQDTPTLSACTSMTELIPTLDFDLENCIMLSDQESSDIVSLGVPPSRRSSGSFLYAQASSTTSMVESAPRRSVIRSAKHQRRRRDAVPEYKNASEKARGGDNRPGIRITSREEKEPDQRPTQFTSESVAESASARLMVDTASWTPGGSTSTGWFESFDLMTGSITVSSWSQSERASSVMEFQTFDNSLLYGEALVAGRTDPSNAQNRRSSIGSLAQRPPSIASSFADYAVPSSRKSNSRRLSHSPKDFQEALVDIILENDVHDLLDLEEFLQGYFKLNSFYQDIIQQFFNDLSNDLVNPQVSRASSVIARLASASSNKALSITRPP